MTDLNEFFAKKDKKKPKGSIKFATINEIDKKLHKTDKKREKYLKQIEDNDWKDFVEKKPDYSGLKIQNTNLNNEDDDTGTDEDNMGDPWTDVDQPEEVQLQKPQIDDDKSPAWKLPMPDAVAYIPPHLRNKCTLKIDRNHKSTLINDESFFPSLPSKSNIATLPKSWKEVRPN